MNGLVVPAGDVDLLADALRALVDDPEAARATCAKDARRRSPSGRSTSRSTVSSAGCPSSSPAAARRRASCRRPTATRADRARVVWACGITGAPLRYRARLPAEAIGLLGVQTDVVYYRDPAVARAGRAGRRPLRLPGAGDPSVPRAHRRVRSNAASPSCSTSTTSSSIPTSPPRSPRSADPVAARSRGLAVRRAPLPHDDGALRRVHRQHAAARSGTRKPSPAFRRRSSTTASASCSHELSDRAVARRRQPGPLRIGYLSGTITHDHDWFYVEPAIVEMLDRHPDVELWLGGHLPDSPALERFGGRVRRIPFTPWTQLPGICCANSTSTSRRSSPGSRFNEAKSAIKWLEAALVATPTDRVVDRAVPGRHRARRKRLHRRGSRRLAPGARPAAHRSAGAAADRRARPTRGAAALVAASAGPALPRDPRRGAGMAGPRRAPDPPSDWAPAIADEPFEPSALDRYSTGRFAGDGHLRRPAALPRSLDRWTVPAGACASAARRSRSSRAVPYGGRQMLAAARDRRAHRPRRSSSRTRRGTRATWCASEGLIHTAGRAVRFTGKRSRTISAPRSARCPASASCWRPCAGSAAASTPTASAGPSISPALWYAMPCCTRSRWCGCARTSSCAAWRRCVASRPPARAPRVRSVSRSLGRRLQGVWHAELVELGDDDAIAVLPGDLVGGVAAGP